MYNACFVVLLVCGAVFATATESISLLEA